MFCKMVATQIPVGFTLYKKIPNHFLVKRIELKRLLLFKLAQTLFKGHPYRIVQKLVAANLSKLKAKK